AREYVRPMKGFLNRYMAANRDLKRQSEKDLRTLFEETVSVIKEAIGLQAFRPKRAINAAVVDSLMTGVAKCLTGKGKIKNPSQLREQYDALMKTKEYLSAIETGTAQEANVQSRLRLAEEAFEKVK